ncbi:mannose-6-phosphate isomerase, class I [Clostridium sp.]|uniref:mannose-6-phosphate isomerase, class I n=1 Tax=Clostridium sp. TaxID=1506 RepID=UPI003F36FE46
MYPIKFNNVYFEKVWGGRDFGNFRDNLPGGNIGESWDIACHPNGVGIVENGELKGLRFDEIISKYGSDLLGDKILDNKFPLLVKLINSKEKLSVQVHPGDEYAKVNENEFGKTEAWYVMDANPNAKLIVGTKNCDKETFKRKIQEGDFEDCLNIIEVKKGDCFLINSGLVHAICEGLIIAEIQQNSDVTYRVYDYGRPRELHVKKSLDVIKFDLKAINLSENPREEFNGYRKIDLCNNEYFGMIKYEISSELRDESNKDKLYILTCIEGSGDIVVNNEKYKIIKGDSYLIPATMGEYYIKGSLELIKSYPN